MTWTWQVNSLYTTGHHKEKWFDKLLINHRLLVELFDVSCNPSFDHCTYGKFMGEFHGG